MSSEHPRLEDQKAEILYLAYNRLEFTKKSFSTMVKNTPWEKITRLVVYDDGSTDGTREYLIDAIRSILAPTIVEFRETKHIGPVGIMNDYIIHCGNAKNDTLFVKIDNDVMLPPNWFQKCIRIMFLNPEIDLLGIEAMYTQKDVPPELMGLTSAQHIGGIGFMRTRAFTDCLPRPLGRFGFTNWQLRHTHLKKYWLNPAIYVNLLNRVPIEPWKSLSLDYERKGWQRKEMGGFLPLEEHAQWDWWANA